MELIQASQYLNLLLQNVKSSMQEYSKEQIDAIENFITQLGNELDSNNIFLHKVNFVNLQEEEETNNYDEESISDTL
jgi:hypothetical protein